MKKNRITRAFSLKSKLLLGTVGLGLTIVTIGSWGTYKTTKSLSKANSSAFNTRLLESKTIGSRFWGGFLARLLGRVLARPAFKTGVKMASIFSTGYGVGQTVAEMMDSGDDESDD